MGIHHIAAARQQGQQARSRKRIALALLVTIGLGLGSRMGASWLPPFLVAHAGDALWTVAVYLSLALIAPAAPPLWLGATALILSGLVECSQLLQTPLLETVRATLPGRLLLGSGFLWIDLVRYFVGALGATWLDSRWAFLRNPAKPLEDGAPSSKDGGRAVAKEGMQSLPLK